MGMSYEELGVFGRLRKVFPMTFFPMTKWNEILALTERVVGFPLWSGPYVPDISGHLERNLLSCISRWKSTLLKVLQLIPGHIIRILSSLYRWSDSSTSTVWTDTNWLCWLLHTMPKATPQMTTGQSRHMIIRLTRTIHHRGLNRIHLGVRFDLRQFLYNTAWSRQFRTIDEHVKVISATEEKWMLQEHVLT